MIIETDSKKLMQRLLGEFPELKEMLRLAAEMAKGSAKQRVYEYQAAALYWLLQPYNRECASILEIGTYYGYTAAVMALAAPRAMITTLNPCAWEYDAARINLAKLANVRPLCVHSWDYLKGFSAAELDFVFVDGDHKRIEEDLAWWKWLLVGGMMLFHDYSPNGSGRPCPPVFRALNRWAEKLGRAPDVMIIDEDRVGMVGWIKREGE